MDRAVRPGGRRDADGLYPPAHPMSAPDNLLILLADLVILIACIAGIVVNQRLVRRFPKMPRWWHQTQRIVLIGFCIDAVAAMLVAAYVVYRWV